jgi:hypothetical protein
VGLLANARTGAEGPATRCTACSPPPFVAAQRDGRGAYRGYIVDPRQVWIHVRRSPSRRDPPAHAPKTQRLPPHSAGSWIRPPTRMRRMVRYRVPGPRSNAPLGRRRSFLLGGPSMERILGQDRKYEEEPGFRGRSPPAIIKSSERLLAPIVLQSLACRITPPERY